MENGISALGIRQSALLGPSEEMQGRVVGGYAEPGLRLSTKNANGQELPSSPVLGVNRGLQAIGRHINQLYQRMIPCTNGQYGGVL
jgi:hypothetical protein